MERYILLLPIIFIFHDMEEIVGFEKFFRHNPDLFDRFPKILAAYRGRTTRAFAAAVYEEFIPFFGVSLAAYYFPCPILNTLWFSLLISLTAHFVVHIGQAVFIRRYIPSLITSIICLPPSLIILMRTAGYISFDALAMFIIPAGIILMAANLRFAHAVMRAVDARDCYNRNVICRSTEYHKVRDQYEKD